MFRAPILAGRNEPVLHSDNRCKRRLDLPGRDIFSKLQCSWVLHLGACGRKRGGGQRHNSLPSRQMPNEKGTYSKDHAAGARGGHRIPGGNKATTEIKRAGKKENLLATIKKNPSEGAASIEKTKGFSVRSGAKIRSRPSRLPGRKRGYCQSN